MPYQFDFKIAQHQFSADVVVSASEEVVCRHGDNPHRVDLLNMYRASDNLICLDKVGFYTVDYFLVMICVNRKSSTHTL